MTVKMILAVDRGGAIGHSDGRLPWKIKSDLQRFKTLTIGHTVIMGRKTFESLNRPSGLPDRMNVVVSRSSTEPFGGPYTGEHENVRTFNNFELYVHVHQACFGGNPSDLWVIGGANIYAQALDKKLIDEIHLTLVDDVSGGDVVAPYDIQDWKLFIIRERNRNVFWEVVEFTNIRGNQDEPSTTYLKLVKQ